MSSEAHAPRRLCRRKGRELYNRSNKEDEYFLRAEAEKLKKLAEKHQEEMAEAERQYLKEMHYMKCPKCGMDLKEIEFRGIQIDKCFSCGGIYFDDGEVEQLMAQEDGEDGFFSRVSAIFKG